MVMRLSSEENLPDWLIEGLIPAYFTMEEALRKRRTSPISDTICAPSVYPCYPPHPRAIPSALEIPLIPPARSSGTGTEKVRQTR